MLSLHSAYDESPVPAWGQAGCGNHCSLSGIFYHNWGSGWKEGRDARLGNLAPMWGTARDKRLRRNCYSRNGPILQTGLPAPLRGLLNFPRPGFCICSILIRTVHFWGAAKEAYTRACMQLILNWARFRVMRSVKISENPFKSV